MLMLGYSMSFNLRFLRLFFSLFFLLVCCVFCFLAMFDSDLAKVVTAFLLIVVAFLSYYEIKYFLNKADAFKHYISLCYVAISAVLVAFYLTIGV